MRSLLCVITIFAVFLSGANGGELSESESFFSFIRSVDPRNNLRIDGLPSNPCLWKAIKCSLYSYSITEINLENMNLSGIIDIDSLCKLRNLRVVNIATNHIQGNIPDTISTCTNLRYLNISGNLLNGSIPSSLFKLKKLSILDISGNYLAYETENLERYSVWSNSIAPDGANAPESVIRRPSFFTRPKGTPKPKKVHQFPWWSQLVLGITFFGMIAAVVIAYVTKLVKVKKIDQKGIVNSPPESCPLKSPKEVKGEERNQELVFFVQDEEKFKLEDLLEAGADLQSQNFCSSLYKVQLENKGVYAVKRLKKLQASFVDFDRTMSKVGELKHPNILPLVAYRCPSVEMLLIYKYQSKGSLLKQMESYIAGKRDFPWKLRLSIAVGIARGLDHIYRSFEDSESIFHGNLKPSNIMLNENDEPLISEYGYSKFLDPKSTCIFSSNGYTAPERTLSEKGDVFSFGVILMELLTGKIVQNSGLDLPKWVKAMVREEWTGEVFDREVANVGIYAFPLLNISLKCVAHFPENRPSMAEVLEKIEQVVHEHEDHSFSSATSIDSTPRDVHCLYSVAEESCDGDINDPIKGDKTTF